MGTSQLLEFSIIVFAGLVLATLVTPIKRALPHWYEAAVWLALIVACWLAVTNALGGRTKDLTESALWGADQIISTSLGLIGMAILGWAGDHRFALANAAAVIAAVDVLLLVLLRSWRRAMGWQPRVKLREWFE